MMIEKWIICYSRIKISGDCEKGKIPGAGCCYCCSIARRDKLILHVKAFLGWILVDIVVGTKFE